MWKDLAMESPEKDSIFSGILVMANTKIPVAKRVAVNLRWGVNFPADFGKKMPFLSVNKIGIERVDEVKEVKGVKEMSSEGNVGDSEMLKGMLSWMRKELDVLQRENREIKHNLEEMKLANSKSNYGGGKKPVSVVENSSGFEQWRSKKSGGEEIGKKESSKVVNSMTDVESELQRAIKAASSS